MTGIFTYGTLQVPEVFTAVTGRKRQSRHAVLHGYARYGIRQRAFPGIVPEADSYVEGRYYPRLDERTVAALDAFEDILYRRRAVTVLIDGSPVAAQAYVVAPRYRHWLSDTPWDLATFIDQHLPRYLKHAR